MTATIDTLTPSSDDSDKPLTVDERLACLQVRCEHEVGGGDMPLLLCVLCEERWEQCLAVSMPLAPVARPASARRAPRRRSTPQAVVPTPVTSDSDEAQPRQTTAWTPGSTIRAPRGFVQTVVDVDDDAPAVERLGAAVRALTARPNFAEALEGYRVSVRPYTHRLTVKLYPTGKRKPALATLRCTPTQAKDAAGVRHSLRGTELGRAGVILRLLIADIPATKEGRK